MLISYKKNLSKVSVAELSKQKLDVIKSSNEDSSAQIETHNEVVPLQKPFPKIVGLIILNEFCERYYFYSFLFFSN